MKKLISLVSTHGKTKEQIKDEMKKALKNFIDKTGIGESEEISQTMKKVRRSALAQSVRMTPEEEKIFRKGLKGMIDNLNKNVTDEK